MDYQQLRAIEKAEDVTDHMLVLVADVVESWFPPEGEPLTEEDFIDRLARDYLNDEGIEIETLDTPATRKIMRHARRVRREMA